MFSLSDFKIKKNKGMVYLLTKFQKFAKIFKVKNEDEGKSSSHSPACQWRNWEPSLPGSSRSQGRVCLSNVGLALAGRRVKLHNLLTH